MTFSLRLTSCQARNSFPMMTGLANYLHEKLQIATHYEDGISWSERYQALYVGEINMGFICPRLYALQLRTEPQLLKGIAAPVMRGGLYKNRAIYYSYLVVQDQHPAQTLLELRHGRVAFNDRSSQSGFFSLLHALREISAGPHFFSEWIESGAHLNSITLLRAGTVDAAAIDSTLWDYELSLDLHTFDDLKVIDTIGPFPSPLLAAHPKIPTHQRRDLTRVLTQMHLEPAGQALLQTNLISHFVEVNDSSYSCIV